MHAGEMEVHLARYLNYRQNLIVPNVSWGLGYYEKDLVVVRPSRLAWEIEIKISLSDLKNDLKKSHGHNCDYIKYLYFAVPAKLEKQALLLIPERAGLFIVDIYKNYKRNDPYYNQKGQYYVRCVRSPIANPKARKLNDKEMTKLYELAAMRIWSLKEVIYRLQEEKPKKRLT